MTKEKAMSSEYADLLSEILESENIRFSTRERFLFLKKFLERIAVNLTEDNSSLQFPTLFSRLVYISKKLNLSDYLSWSLQNIRVKTTFLLKDEANIVSSKEYLKALESIKLLLSIIYDNRNLKNEDKKNDSIDENGTIIDKTSNNYLRIQVTNVDKTNHIITGIKFTDNTLINIKYNIPKVNDNFTESLNEIWLNAQINIIDYYIDDYDYYRPKIFVLEPDYLVDASAIAECFQYYGSSHLHYFRRKIESISNTKHILLGNLANFFLDELIFSENTENDKFDQKFVKAFQQKPFEFTSCLDINSKSSFIEFMKKAKKQFVNIKRTILNDFKANNINIKNCILEPSFFSEKYGFQGRLDLLDIENLNENLQIVELKSGGLPFPKNDPLKISITHEVQTSIYQLIISGVFNKKNIYSAILYSSAEFQNQNLRYAAPYQTLNKEILNLRNNIIATEHNLSIGSDDKMNIFFNDLVDSKNYGNTPEYFLKQTKGIQQIFKSLSKLEKKYIYRFFKFITTDLYIFKVGGSAYENSTSLANLWNTSLEDRIESFNAIKDLKISFIDDSENDLKILLQKENQSIGFTNFREGELCILYPKDNSEDTILTNQIMKGYIYKLSDNNIELRFRYKQKNKNIFQIHNSWVVEHDYLDHSYINMYKSLFNFCKIPKIKREILLGIVNYDKTLVTDNKLITDNINYNENTILKKIITAKDYFLLVGPPGTGKTSIYAKEILKYYYENTSNNILLIAHTNKAVDELCETICNTFNIDNSLCNKYIRIGTELSCNSLYRHRLLQNITDKVKNRKEFLNILEGYRIFVGTLASIVGKKDLFNLKKFNIAIVDEASQILEPQIIGLLSSFDKFIMIGDHKQLSTITLQDNSQSKIEDPILNKIELYDCKESLFERLYRICKKNNWQNNFDTLNFQGRMHQEIQKFPNKYFYDNILEPIKEWQFEDLVFNKYRYTNVYSKIVFNNRIAFINVAKEGKDDTFFLKDKINHQEANCAMELCKAIIDNYLLNDIAFDPQKTLGIITPFRNQIALIKSLISKEEKTYKDLLSNIMIDTVERFQGSQKDIIIVSFCMNKIYQLNLFCNWDRDKIVDRKLNVALTRARKQLFLIGNKNILNKIPLYKELIDHCTQ